MLHATQNGIPAAKREPLVKNLNGHLAALIDLSYQAKQAHWNIRGPNFIALHELFDKVHEVAETQVDIVAERLTQLGGTAEGTIDQVAKNSKLKPYPREIMDGLEHVKALSAAVAATSNSVRDDIEFADEHDDMVTADLYTGVAGVLDLQLWFLEAHLK